MANAMTEWPVYGHQMEWMQSFRTDEVERMTYDQVIESTTPFVVQELVSLSEKEKEELIKEFIEHVYHPRKILSVYRTGRTDI